MSTPQIRIKSFTPAEHKPVAERLLPAVTANSLTLVSGDYDGFNPYEGNDELYTSYNRVFSHVSIENLLSILPRPVWPDVARLIGPIVVIQVLAELEASIDEMDSYSCEIEIVDLSQLH